MPGVAGAERNANPARLGPQLLPGEAAGTELVTIGSIKIALPEMLAKSQALGEIEDDVGIGASLAWRRDHDLAVLHERLRLQADLKANFQGLPLEAGRDRQHDVSQHGGRRHEEIGVGIEIQLRKGGTSSTRVALCEQQVVAKA